MKVEELDELAKKIIDVLFVSCCDGDVQNVALILNNKNNLDPANNICEYFGIEKRGNRQEIRNVIDQNKDEK